MKKNLDYFKIIFTSSHRQRQGQKLQFVGISFSQLFLPDAMNSQIGLQCPLKISSCGIESDLAIAY
jgi:hypothetical protein